MGRSSSICSSVHIVIALVAIFCCCNLAYAGTDKEVRLFVVEKSKNPQNILVVYANADADCRIEPISDAGSQHLFDLYWLMDGARFKQTHRLIKKAVRKRFVAQELADNGQIFTVVLTDLKELHHDLPTDRIRVELNSTPNGSCQSRVLLQLGPSHNSRTLTIQSIYSEAKTFFSIPVGIHYIELRGTDIQSNEPIVVRFNSNGEADNIHADDVINP